MNQEILSLVRAITPELEMRINDWLASDMILGSKEHQRLELELWENKIGILRVLQYAAGEG